MDFKKTVSLVMVGFALAVNAHAQSWITNGLLAYFPFSGNANDVSGNGKNGTVFGATLAADRFGVTNAAYHFTGGQYIDIPLDCSSQKPLTYSLWVQQDTTVQGLAQSLIWTGTFDAPSHNVGINPTNNLYAEFYPHGAYHSASKFLVGKWTHIVVTWSDKMILYVNSVPVGAVDYPSAPGFRSAVTRFGRSQDFYINAFVGTLDNIRIYNRALSTNEVEQLYLMEAPEVLNVKRAVYLDSSNLKVGTNYQVQVSGNLTNWTNYGSAFTATTNTWRTTNYWDVENWRQLYFRLQKQ